MTSLPKSSEEGIMTAVEEKIIRKLMSLEVGSLFLRGTHLYMLEKFEEHKVICKCYLTKYGHTWRPLKSSKRIELPAETEVIRVKIRIEVL
jgi:hypothetical protein